MPAEKFGRDLVRHEVLTVEKAGLKGFEKGALMLHARDAGFDVVISVDKNIENQQKPSRSAFGGFDFVGKNQSL